MRVPALDSRTQRRPLPKHMLLPNQLIETMRPHPHSQRCIGSYLPNGTGLVAVEQTVGHRG